MNLLVIARVQLLDGDRARIAAAGRVCEQAADRFRARRARFRLARNPGIELRQDSIRKPNN